jgi:recombination protein RecA
VAKTKLDDLLKSMEKKFGKGSTMLIGDGKIPVVPRIPVDSPRISYLLGGGIPMGRVLELFGAEAAGKTSFACYLAGQVQKAQIKIDDKETRQGRVAFIDAENALDHEYAKTFDFDISEAIYCQPDSGEDALQMAIDLSESGEVDFIIIDSVAALTPTAELNGEVGDQQMGAQARMMGKGLRKISAGLSKNQCSVLFLNQVRMKIGVLWGNPETTPGGKALPFFSSVRMRISRRDSIDDHDEQIGQISGIKTVKNKTAPPQRNVLMKIIFGKGVQTKDEWIEFACKYDIIKKAGAGWMTMPDGTKKQGNDQALEYLKEKGMYDDLIEKTKKAMFPSQLDDGSTVFEEDEIIEDPENVVIEKDPSLEIEYEDADIDPEEIGKVEA